MKIKISSLIILLCLIFCNACRTANQAKEEAFDMPDIKVNKETSATEVVFDDSATENKGESVSPYGESPQGYTNIADDGSTIDTSFDGAGNKIEMRYFNNHPNIKSVSVTHGKNGNEVIVFGHNREFRKLSSETAEQIMNMTGTEIANLSGIHTIEKRRSQRVMDGKPPKQPSPVNNQPYRYPPPLPQPPVTENQGEGQKQAPNQSSEPDN